MIDSCGVTTGPAGQLGAMVQTPSSMYVYWRLAAPPPGALVVRVSDMSGRPAARSLEGKGWREMEVATGATATYLQELIPGRPYLVELGVREDSGFRPLISAPLVEPPRLPAAGYRQPTFPHPYARS